MKKKAEKKTDTSSRCFTLKTRLKGKENQEAIQYFLEFASFWNSILRHVWHMMKKIGFSLNKKETSELNTFLQQKFGISRRTATSIIYEVLGRFEALKAVYEYNLSQSKLKLAKTTEKRDRIKEYVNERKPKASNNQLTEKELNQYRKKKKELYNLNRKLEKLNHKIEKLENRIKNNDFSMCFGTKKLFKAQYHLEENGFRSHEEWLIKFREKRDANILYIGSKGESHSNSIFQLMSEDDGYSFKVRKNTKERTYAKGKCSFKYRNEELLKFVEDSSIHGVAYQIHFEKNRCYLLAMITQTKKQTGYITRRNYGTIGLDFNQGLIELAETNEHGNLVYQRSFRLKYHRNGTSNQAENEIKTVVSEIVKYSASVGKDLVIESLDFSKKKGKTTEAKSEQGKEYNRMLHSLDYARYTKFLENAAFRNNVYLQKVNPAYTSKIPKKKYCSRMKLTSHQGAAFEIARKGQNWKFFKRDMKVLAS